MNKKPVVKLAMSVTALVLTALAISPVSRAQIRVTTPSFPSCTNPQGQIIASYQTGVHGIPGDYTTHTGSDKVYSLTADTLTQCFCAENAEGIQTNWWKVSSLSLDEIDFLQAQGWIYVPNGAEWGLQEAPYLAKNSEFSCKNDDGDDDDDNDDDDDDDDNDDNGRGSILGISTIGQVLGLATTGNWATIVLSGVIGTLTMGTGIYLLIKAHAKKENA